MTALTVAAGAVAAAEVAHERPEASSAGRQPSWGTTMSTSTWARGATRARAWCAARRKAVAWAGEVIPSW